VTAVLRRSGRRRSTRLFGASPVSLDDLGPAGLDSAGPRQRRAARLPVAGMPDEVSVVVMTQVLPATALAIRNKLHQLVHQAILD
jgi:hypothetical protein